MSQSARGGAWRARPISRRYESIQEPRTERAIRAAARQGQVWIKHIPVRSARKVCRRWLSERLLQIALHRGAAPPTPANAWVLPDSLRPASTPIPQPTSVPATRALALCVVTSCTAATLPYVTDWAQASAQTNTNPPAVMNLPRPATFSLSLPPRNGFPSVSSRLSAAPGRSIRLTRGFIELSSRRAMIQPERSCHSAVIPAQKRSECRLAVAPIAAPVPHHAKNSTAPVFKS